MKILLVLLLFTILGCVNADAKAESKTAAKPSAKVVYPVSSGFNLYPNNVIGVPHPLSNSLYNNLQGVITNPYNTGYLYGSGLYDGNILNLYGGQSPALLPHYGIPQGHNLYGIGSVPLYGINTPIPNQVYGGNIGALGVPFFNSVYQPHLNQGLIPSYIKDLIHPPVTGVSSVQHNQYHPISSGYPRRGNRIPAPGSFGRRGYNNNNRRTYNSPLLNSVEVEQKNKDGRVFGKVEYDSYSSVEYP